ncbi:helix-turn-helix domain-containing protein [Pseudoroseicyclus aestuarii]|uniref:HTH cro/C1-type domain-containing protein n=1 Tax=Pseudoroseicyclus aestuarii TaxID=1795041 RepID=A0A318SP03_9RHOB|nr:helix-turn-helix transcriptional regulator [Pseudoroseicyclus aestuarii]PYE81305.1 hypothetical protein DFP88_10796 [Pseudoroseicyclus aestuarii]
MSPDEKEKLVRHRDSTPQAIALRLRAARQITGLNQKDFAAAAGVAQTTYNSQEVKGSPSIKVMAHLYRDHRVDFNFLLYGDYNQLPGDVQSALFAALSSAKPDPDAPAN